MTNATEDITPSLAALISTARGHFDALTAIFIAQDGASDADLDRLRKEEMANPLSDWLWKILQHPANTLQDMLAKFSAIRDMVGLYDIGHYLPTPKADQGCPSTDVMWYVLADLVALDDKERQT